MKCERAQVWAEQRETYIQSGCCQVTHQPCGGPLRYQTAAQTGPARPAPSIYEPLSSARASHIHHSPGNIKEPQKLASSVSMLDADGVFLLLRERAGPNAQGGDIGNTSN
ncbi:unnamed protein product [Pleuronectes platessa]|uniref:Uncharacterized protein n=1 Tax=Pleuronectes platessa TaxID=8262 RepID=A0A9N7THT5_PLEPL|nr:unnamed protein product [Pleuronectes platessa]